MTARTGNTTHTEKWRLRRALRTQRRELPAVTRRRANSAIIKHLGRHYLLRKAGMVSAFIAFDGEVDLGPLLQKLLRAGKGLCLPLIRRHGMSFHPYRQGQRLRSNRFGISEPGTRRRIHPLRIDIVLTPLVGFDAQGTRLGVGGGYYDRYFSFLRNRQCYWRPKLIGVAYALQEITTLPREAWDIPLWGVVTENGFRLLGER